jgi:glycerophosphoryl diester phosphodiesterase
VPTGFFGPTPRLLGHRGAAGIAPENTLISFARARADGADIFELDVHATADGEVVVIHDATLDRTTSGCGAVRAHTWSEVRGLDAGFHFSPDRGHTFPFRAQGVTIPRLVDLLEQFPDVPLNIEIKQADPPIVEAVVDLVRRARAPVVLAAELDEIMRAIRRVAPDLPTSLSAGEVAAFHAAVSGGTSPVLPRGAIAFQIPPRFGAIELVTETTVDAAHALGAEVHVWTINDPDEMCRLLDLGCDAIISDFPALARTVIDEWRRAP